MLARLGLPRCEDAKFRVDIYRPGSWLFGSAPFGWGTLLRGSDGAALSGRAGSGASSTTGCRVVEGGVGAAGSGNSVSIIGFTLGTGSIGSADTAGALPAEEGGAVLAGGVSIGDHSRKKGPFAGVSGCLAEAACANRPRFYPKT